MFEPQTPQKSAVILPDRNVDKFSVKINVCFFKVHENTGGLVGLQENEGQYIVPSAFLKNGFSPEEELRKIEKKYIPNIGLINNHTETMLCGWDNSRKDRLSFVYCCFISSFSSSKGLSFFEKEKIIQAMEDKKITQEQYAIVEKALGEHVSTK